MTITRLAHFVILAFGWQRAMIAFAAGAASALAMAPINAWPILFVTFPVLIWLVDGSASGRWGAPVTAALAGWCFGFGYFLTGLYWIGYAFLVDAKTFGWLLPVAVAGLPAYLALYTALGLAAARLIWVRGPERILALAATLTASRVAARPSAQRISLEHFRLRTHPTFGAGAKRLAGRHLDTDLLLYRHLRNSGSDRR